MEDEIKTEQFITTIDNPFNPFTQFKEWYSYDRALGYDTCCLIDRFYSSLIENDESLNEEQKELLQNEAMKRIVSIHPEIYHTISNDTFIQTVPIDGETVDEDLFE